MKVEIVYLAHKSMIGGFKPIVMVNGQPRYFPNRNKKTMRGALSVAKRTAEDLAAMWRSASKSNVVTVEVQA